MLPAGSAILIEVRTVGKRLLQEQRVIKRDTDFFGKIVEVGHMSKITNYKSQITNKSKSPKLQIQNGYVVFGI